jgi:alanyl-tRNA synthetase
MVPVVDTKKENNLIIHIVPRLPQHLDQPYKAEVDKCRRIAIQCNHSATHLLHKALRNVLGTHVEQKGSSVDDSRLRFDFSHFAKLSHDEIREVEKQVNIDIRRAIALEEHRAMPIDEARKLGAMALFGEKYGDKVRVVKFGDSVEFCGGTHIDNTGHIGSFRIVSEGAVAAGMRRIEAVTGAAAESYNNNLQDQLDALRELLKSPKDLLAAVQRLQDDNAALRAEVEKYQKEQANAMKQEFARQLEQSPLLVRRMDSDLSQLKDAMLALATQYPDMAVVLGSVCAGKPALLVARGKSRVDAGLNAGAIVRAAGKEIQGGGGGQPAYATAGGKNPDGLDAALHVAEEMLK